MSFQATVYRVLIASPGDLLDERAAIERAVHRWNAAHADNEGIVLLPVRWETHAVPQYGMRPQEAINRSLVDDCDILIGAFWTRIGSHTGEAESGTVEEIERFGRDQKPALLYFSRRPVDPRAFRSEQWDRLEAFRARLRQIALIGEFSSPDDLAAQLAHHLYEQVRRLQAGRDPDTGSAVSQADGRAAPAPEHAASTPTEENHYLRFWTGFRDVVLKSDLDLRAPSPSSKNWARISLRRSHFYINAFASTTQRFVGVELVIKGPAREQIFRDFEDHRGELERRLGYPLTFNPQDQSNRIVLVDQRFDPADENDWERQHRWLTDRLREFRDVLVPRLPPE